ncbi:Acetyltransferase [Alkalibacterium sp. AK22]|uniref:GNAT family N-acetyltransferase n=1 Tax=Alkalibacterium sp. AK22 TaxID=1229520 RepID=UPI00044F0330|nr:GNAT family N-acetyltransferase [Alkalibacterium sp. AK22]EXJ23401.1 Acetyltransferase [Alkalibacterium sp. AK22]
MSDHGTQSNQAWSLHTGNEPWNQAAAYYVRMTVFVLEREIDLADEFDAEDHDKRVYTVIYDGNKPVATGRYIKVGEQTVRPGRICVLKDYRGQGLGEQIVRELETHAQKQGCSQSEVHGELTAASFYEKLGYVKTGDPYLEDGVPCVTLIRALETIS